MCKVRITNRSNNYITFNSAKLEVDIPSDSFLVFKQIFEELNKTRSNAASPTISIEKI